MVPKIIAKGTSFKGAAQYLLHDKGTLETSERVAWTEVRNLMSDDPDMAWRIMASTAMDQSRLKANAGVPNTGRKSNKSVLHLSLAWHPEEAEGLTQEDMIYAADGAIQAIGADNRQMLIVAHDDEDHPHLHILCNRVCPENGVMLPSSNDRLKLSEWAQQYEEERGKVYCGDRVSNNERRKEGEYVKGKRNQSRHIIEASRVVNIPSNDNKCASGAVMAEQSTKDHSLAIFSREVADKQKREWARFQDNHQQKKTSLANKTQQNIKNARQLIADKFRLLRGDLKSQFHNELTQYDKRDQNIGGKLQNTWQAVNLATQNRDKRDDGNALSRIFRVLTKKDARRDEVLKDQSYRKILLQRKQKLEFQAEKAEMVKQRNIEMDQMRSSFLLKREQLIEQQAKEKADLQSVWQEREKIRNAAFQNDQDKVSDMRRKFTDATGGENKSEDRTAAIRDSLVDNMADDYEHYASPPSNDYDHER